MGTNRPTTPQAITVEWTVTGELDGVTPAPQVNIDPTDDARTKFDEKTQIYLPEAVENLGLIDPDLLIGGSIGVRCIPFLTLDTDETGAPGAAVDVVGVRTGSDDDVFLQRRIEDLAGSPGPVFLDEGFNVPQGSDIRLRGYVAGADPIKVRATVLVPASCLEIAAFKPPAAMLVGGRGAISFIGNTVPTVNPGAGGFVPIGTGNAATHAPYVLDSPANDVALVGTTAPTQELEYTGTQKFAGILYALVSAGVTTGVGATTYTIRVLQNGVECTRCRFTSVTGGLLVSAAFNAVQLPADVSPGDKFQIEIANDLDARDLTVLSARIGLLI